ncbi:MAG: AmmeMemoRadiSam system protein B [Acidobacteriia bacterium]|nr:AmmeMemoRadiSam system protein B [Terriglobia bacterium]
MIREPAVAGQFYPANPQRLQENIRSFLSRSEALLDVKGIVAPHAGYVYSGGVAGAVYAAVRLPRRFIILGPNHTGKGVALSLYPSGQWRTPLGLVGIDEELNRSLVRECSLLVEDTAAHVREHSIEVQIPFLQSLADAPRFSAICVGTSDYASLETLGHALARVVQSTSEPVLLVASSDMSHYEPADVAARKDRFAIDRVVGVDPHGLYQTIFEKDISMCGFAPAVAVLTACRDLGATSGQLIRYATSGDVSGDYEHVVAYAGMAVF